jgi:hypothetical protein
MRYKTVRSEIFRYHRGHGTNEHDQCPESHHIKQQVAIPPRVYKKDRH